MGLLAFLAVSSTVLLVAYRLIGRFLARKFALDAGAQTPAHRHRDGLDFEPARTAYLLPQHLSAIAAAGPVVGPILAAIYFGWGPAWIWIIVGGILIGGIHDFAALVGSVRHGGRTIAEIVRQHMNPRAHLLFLVFVWLALVYVIIAFTDVTAATFVAKASVEGGDAPGPAVASSSLLYLGLALAMGATLRFAGMSPLKAKLIYLPLVLLAIVAGSWIPLDLGPLFDGKAQVAWGFILLAYCFFAALSPVWLLLQPRGELGGYFLYFVMIVVVVGVAVGAVVGGQPIQLPFFKGWESAAGAPLFPILFITVACGACSGFHSIIASGTTSKQLDKETDAVPVAYGSMLLESFFACITLATVMILANPAGAPPSLYAGGIATFARGIVSVFSPVVGELSNDQFYALFYQFALLCFATFVFDTLDACTRLARYVLMEALRWTTRPQAIAATLITLALPAMVLLVPPVVVAGKPMPLWQVFWGIFGSSNQLLAALSLLALTVWLARKRMAWWITFFPTVFMMFMTLWSLFLNIGPYVKRLRGTDAIEPFAHMQFAITVSLIVLSGWLIVEALITWRTMIGGPPREAEVGGEEPAVAV